LPQSPRERIDAVEQSPWSLNLDFTELQALARYMYAYSAKPGERLLCEGSEGNYLVLIITGQVEIVKQDFQGKVSVLAQLGPGKVIGEMSLIDKEPRSATAIAKNDVSFLVLTRRDFEVVVDENPRLAFRFVKQLAKINSQRLRQTTGKLLANLRVSAGLTR